MTKLQAERDSTSLGRRAPLRRLRGRRRSARTRTDGGDGSGASSLPARGHSDRGAGTGTQVGTEGGSRRRSGRARRQRRCVSRTVAIWKGSTTTTCGTTYQLSRLARSQGEGRERGERTEHLDPHTPRRQPPPLSLTFRFAHQLPLIAQPRPWQAHRRTSCAAARERPCSSSG